MPAVEQRRTFIAEAQHGELEVIAKMVSGLINGLDRRVDWWFSKRLAARRALLRP